MSANCYVYLHRKATNGEIFYVGKGRDWRAWSREPRNNLWERIVNKYGYYVEIYMDGLQDWYAYEIEEQLILKYGRIQLRNGCLANMNDGGAGSTGLSEESLAKFTGINHYKADKTEYTFYNIYTREVFIGTRIGLENKIGKRVANLFGKTKDRAKGSLFGWVIWDNVSDEDIEWLKNKYVGTNNANADLTEYTFINAQTGQVVVSNRFNFEREYLDGKGVARLFYKNKGATAKGWFVDEMIDEDRKIKLMQHGKLVGISGKDHASTDHTKYDLRHMNGDRFYGTRYEFKDKYGIIIDRVINGAVLVALGWYLYDRIDEICKSYDMSEYHLKNKDGREYSGNLWMFRKLYRKDSNSLKRLIDGRIKMCRGWTLA